MAVVYPVALKNTRLTSVVTAIDAGATGGTLQIGTAGFATVLADIVLADPSGTVAAGVLTLSGMPRSDTSANATGTAAEARIRDSNGADVVTGLTVGTTGTNIVLNTVSIVAAAVVEITSGTITHG